MLIIINFGGDQSLEDKEMAKKVTKIIKNPGCRTDSIQSKKENKKRQLSYVALKGTLCTVVLFSLTTGYKKYQLETNIKNSGINNQISEDIATQKIKIINSPTDHAITGSSKINSEAMISGNNVLIRETPKINAKIVKRAVFGSLVEVIDQEGKWVKISNPGQQFTGWVEKIYLNF